MTSLQLKAELASYYRFVRQHPVVAVEALSEDLLVVSNSRQLSIIEVKVSTADMRQDRLKSKHADIRNVLKLPLLEKQHSHHSDPLKYGFVPNYFYFAVPREMWEKAEKIRQELYPYAGLITCGFDAGGWSSIPGRASVIRESGTKIHRNRISLRTLSQVVKAQSASLANAYAHLAKRA